MQIVDALFGLVHNFDMLWKQKWFLASCWTHIKNRLQVDKLLSDILLPSWIAIVNVEAAAYELILNIKEMWYQLPQMTNLVKSAMYLTKLVSERI